MLTSQFRSGLSNDIRDRQGRDVAGVKKCLSVLIGESVVASAQRMD
jgi:hypothetical protein